ncbi:hypothetical protein DSECCO2_337070 [anaerobic digester metagenome]
MPFEIFYTDPPWNQTKGGLRKARPNQGKELDYSTLPLEEIEAIHGDFFKQAADQHNVFMWTIDKYLHESEVMMANLGYTRHARMIWDKENGVARAFTVRYSHEYLLWFYPRGKMLKPSESTRGKYRTVMREMATKHSKKPECAYRMLEDMFPDARKLELFARNCRDGWESWGDEMEVIGNIHDNPELMEE